MGILKDYWYERIDVDLLETQKDELLEHLEHPAWTDEFKGQMYGITKLLEAIIDSRRLADERAKFPPIEVTVIKQETATLPWSGGGECMTTVEINGRPLVFVESWEPKIDHAAWYIPGPNTEVDPFEALEYNPAFQIPTTPECWGALRNELTDAIVAALESYEEQT